MMKYIIMVVLGAVSYGMLSSFAKISYAQGYTPAEITFVQAFLGAGILWVLFFLKNLKAGNDKIKKGWQYLVAGSAMGASAYTYYLSVNYIPASLAIVLLMQVTWISMLMEWAFFRIKPSAMEITVACVVLAGTVFAGNLHEVHLDLSLKGIIYALLSSVFYAVYVVFNTRLGKDVPMLAKSALLMTGSAAMILIINARSLLTESHFGTGLLKWGSLLALFGTVIPPVLFAKGMPKIGAGLSAILLTLELPVAVICARLILKEEVSLMQMAGILLMLGAIIFMNLYKLKKAKAQSAVEYLAAA